MKKILILLLFYSITLSAQQESHYTQYMYNMSIVNPAYMTNEPGVYQLGSLYRKQWISISGAPTTANLFAHIPVNEQIEFSLNYVNDQIGNHIKLSRNLFNIDMAYKIKLDEVKNLSFGLKSGGENLTLDASSSNVASDSSFENINKTVFTLGAGVFLFTDNYYLGLSVPNLLPTKIKNSNSESSYTTVAHLNLIGGYIFDLSDMIKFKPSAIVKGSIGSPLSFDLSLNALYNNQFELGVSYRLEDSIGAMATVNVTPNLRLGYAYDYTISDLKDYNNGSHEFILLYKFDFLSLGKKYSSPRFY